MVLPNQLTVARIILTPVFLFLFISGDPLLIQISSVVFIIAALTDWYDGWLARKFNYITEWGKFMDPLADKILTSTAFFAIVAVGHLQLWMVILIVVRDFIITLLRAVADYKKVAFSTSLLAKIKTFMQMAFLYYLLVFITLKTFDGLYSQYKEWFEILLDKTLLDVIMIVITSFTVLTGITYLYSNRILIKKLFSNEN